MSGKNEEIRSMADLLRSGATLTELSCPVCSTPLFKLKSGELWCQRCRKRVVVVKEGEEPISSMKPLLFETLRSTLLSKIQMINDRIQKEEDIEQLHKLNSALSSLLENLEKIRRLERRKT